MKAKTTISNQLTFWDSPITEREIIENHLDDLRQQQGNLRRGFFSRYSLLQQEISQLHDEILTIKKALNPKVHTEEFERDFYQQAENL